MNVLIIGLGSIANKHIHALKQMEMAVTLYALRSGKDSTKHEEVTDIYALDELKVPVDFAIVSNPTSHHADAIKALAERAIPLFIEKPPTGTVAEIEVSLEEVTKKSVFNYVACNLRFHPCIRFVKSKIEAQTLGKINEINIYAGSFLPDWRPGRDYKKIYSANPEMGGGVHLDLFHEIDYAVWLFGLPAAVRATRTNTSSLCIDAVDYANYCLSYPTYNIGIVLNYYRRVAKRTIEIVLEDGIWLIDLIKNTITDEKGNTILDAGVSGIAETYFLQMKYFTDHLKSHDPLMNTLQESAEILKICLTDEG